MWILDEKPNKLKEYYVQQYNNCDCYSIGDAYKCPSDTKVSIWCSYVDKYPDPVGPWKCVGATCFIFTMAAVIKEDDEYYLLHVSKSRDMKVKVRRG